MISITTAVDSNSKNDKDLCRFNEQSFEVWVVKMRERVRRTTMVMTLSKLNQYSICLGF